MSESQYIKNLTVRYFKGLANFSLDGIGGFNILFGANDVGKTSVLEALFLVTGCTNLGLPVRVHNYRSYLVQSVDDFANFFFRLDTDLPIELTASSTSPMECRTLTISTPQIDAPDEVALQQVRSTSHATVVQSDGDSVPARMSSTMSPMPRVLRYEAKMVHPTGRYEFTGDLRMRSPTDFDLPPLPDYARQMVIPARIIMPGLGYEVSAIAELIVRKRDYELLEILRAVSPGAQRITVDAAKAYVDIGLDRMLPLNMFGGGMIRTASILSHCILGDVRVLLVDEIENGFHHTALRPLLEALITLSHRQRVQVFSTSHSIEVLKCLQQILRDEKYAHFRPSTVCFALEKDKHGLVQSYRYDYSQFDHCITNNIELR